MAVKDVLLQVHAELFRCLENLDEAELKDFKDRVLKAERVFVAGAGRSLMMVRGFAMRLMHLGYTAYVVGETVTPAIQPGDLLVIASGSGTTATLTVMAEKCKRIGAELALITTCPNSPIGQMADCIIRVCAATTKDVESAAESVQLGANTFEQCVLLIGDAIVTDLARGKDIDETNSRLMLRHANLE